MWLPLGVSAQVVSVYRSNSTPVVFDVNAVDSVRFSPEQPIEELLEFPYTGSYASPNSKIWGNTGMIPVVYGTKVTYISAGLNDYCCVFFDVDGNAISYGKKAPNYNEGGGKSTILTETLTAPRNSAFVCLYGINRNAKSYVPYTFKAEIDRMA